MAGEKDFNNMLTFMTKIPLIPKVKDKTNLSWRKQHN